MILSGWGKYPKIDCNIYSPHTHTELANLVVKGHAIARGGGRAYGDSAISAANTIQMRWFDQFLDFNPATGVLCASAGVQLREIVQTFLPRGWLLSVTPGTSYVTIGGAIASDVHGKNHHHAGCFGQHLLEMTVLLGSGEIVTASPVTLPDLFHATCGGMGITGIILSAKIQLMPIKSGLIKQKTLKAKNIDELFHLFDTYSNASYSVAWLDCLAGNEELGRSVLMIGEHAEKGELKFNTRQVCSIPYDTPAFLLNRWSIKAFNSLYYRKSKHNDESNVSLFDYFYPLDKIGNWNRMYGSRGFVQYQFVIPKEGGLENMRRIMGKIITSGQGSFLAVIKLFGEANANLLSFPLKGYTLALDFKVNQQSIALIKDLDDMISAMGGRIYLAKDSLMSANTFKKIYPSWEQFEETREKYGAIGKFASAQSLRLGLK